MSLVFNKWEPTMDLRFVVREGKRILQQRFMAFAPGKSRFTFETLYRWKDIPQADTEE